MSNVITVSELDKDVSTYIQKEKEVTKEFLLGVIELGNILKTQRDKWKPKGQWTEYLTRINKHISGANQMIRLYEYSIEHKKELLKSNLTNWNKINLFLALDDEEKEKLAESIDGKDVSSDAFREEVKAVRNVGVPAEVIEVPALADIPMIKEDMKLLSALDEVILMNPVSDVLKVLEELRIDFPFITDNSEQVATAYFCIQKALSILIEKNKLTEDEKSFFKNRFADQLLSLQTVIKKNL